MDRVPAQLRSFNIIPIKENSKQPAINWGEYLDKIYHFSRDWQGNFGVICGLTSSGLVIVDIDSSELYEKFFSSIKTFTVNTPGGGYHLYFLDDDIKRKVPKYMGYPIDIQAQGSYVLIPPSKINDKEYKVYRDEPILRVSVLDLLSTHLPKMERPSDIEEFKKRLSLDEVITSYVIPAYKGKGYWQGLCPFHDERHPSFTVYKDSYYCFGCGRFGDVITFIMEREHLSFREAIDFLAKEFLIPSPFKEKETILFDGDGHPIYSQFIDAVMDEYHFVSTYDNEELYFYQDGYYRGDAATRIKEFIENCFRKQGGSSKTHFVNEIIEAIKRRSYKERASFNPEGYLNLSNGILELESLNLISHTPNMIFTYKLPVEYNREATCPKFMKFLSEVVEEEDIPTIKEMFGYCFMRDNNLQKAFLLVGNGCNGKSTLLSILTALLGKQNVSSESLQNLGNDRFSVARLFGKLANICADIPASPLNYTGIFKMLTGGDLIRGEHKFREPFSFFNQAKLIFSANQFPRVNDISLAFWRRWIVIKFPNSFEGRENLHLKEELFMELSGIFNFALEGYQSLINNGGFSKATYFSQIMEDWRRNADSLYYFVKSCVEVSPNDTITKEDFYNEYCNFCDTNNLLKFSKIEVGKRLPQYVRVRSVIRNVNSRPTTCWEGLKINTHWKGVSLKE